MSRFRTFNLLLCLFFSTMSHVTCSRHAKVAKMMKASKASKSPSVIPTEDPSAVASSQPSMSPSISSEPSYQPSMGPSISPSKSSEPSYQPSMDPSMAPSSHPTKQPSDIPSFHPSAAPSPHPTIYPSASPSKTSKPSYQPSKDPSMAPSSQPTKQPSAIPSFQPSTEPSPHPTRYPSDVPSSQPSMKPSYQPSMRPSTTPSISMNPTITSKPSMHPTFSSEPSANPTTYPSAAPSSQPSVEPSYQPSMYPSATPSISINPSTVPTIDDQMQGSEPGVLFHASDDLGSTVVVVPLHNLILEFKPSLTRSRGRRLNRRIIEQLENIRLALKQKLKDTCDTNFRDLAVSNQNVNLSPLEGVYSDSVLYTIESTISSSQNAILVVNRKDDITSAFLDELNKPDFKSELQILGVSDITFENEVTDINNRIESVADITLGGSDNSKNNTTVIAACSVAAFSIIAAITIIIVRRERIFGERYMTTPTKNSTTTRSPASDFAPINSSEIRLSFLKLEDDSSLERSSIANSDSSLEVQNTQAVSSLGYDKMSTCGDASLYGDCESYGNMSALDDIRLGSVLQIEGSVTDDNSLIERRQTFAQIWGSNRQRMRRTPKNYGRHSRTNSLPSEIGSLSGSRDGVCVNTNRKIAFHNVCLGGSIQSQAEEESFDDSVLNYGYEQNAFESNHTDASSPFANGSVTTADVEALDINKLMYGDGESDDGSKFSVKNPIAGPVGINPQVIT